MAQTLYKNQHNIELYIRKCYRIGTDELHIVTVFDEIRIFEFAYSALPLFYFLFRFKNHLCIVLYIRKALKNRKRLVAYRHSLRSACFAKYRFLNLNILHFRCFIPCLGLKSSLHRVVYPLQSSKRSFRKICIFCTSAVLFLV